MRIGLHLTSFFSPVERSLTQIIDAVVQVVDAQARIDYLQMIAEEIVAKVAST
jgi:hypothetical protein